MTGNSSARALIWRKIVSYPIAKDRPIQQTVRGQIPSVCSMSVSLVNKILSILITVAVFGVGALVAHEMRKLNRKKGERISTA